jgi:hypothetical protein
MVFESPERVTFSKPGQIDRVKLTIPDLILGLFSAILNPCPKIPKPAGWKKTKKSGWKII